MKVDTGVMAPSLSDIGPRARELEELGYDGLLTAETGHDPFLPIALAAEHTERIELAHRHRGRVRPHADGARVHRQRPPADVEGPLRPRPRLADQAAHREAVLDAVVAPGAGACASTSSRCGRSGASWNDGTPLDFEGEFYRHTLMTPFFAPSPNPYGPPKVFLAAVGEKMTEVAGEVADGIIIHGFTTERYVREVTMPAVERGLQKAGRDRATFEVSGPLFVVTGTTDEEIATADAGREAADRVLRLDARVPRRARAARLGRSAARAQRAVEAGRVGRDGRAHRRRDPATRSPSSPSPRASARSCKRRYGGVVDRCSFYAPYRTDPERWTRVIDDLKAA